jgi:hypothetical protein
MKFFLAFMAILMSSFKQPEWLPYAAWLVYFVVVTFQIRSMRTKEKFALKSTTMAVIYGLLAAFVGEASTGLIQSDWSRPIKWSAMAIGLFTVACVLDHLWVVLRKKRTQHE